LSRPDRPTSVRPPDALRRRTHLSGDNPRLTPTENVKSEQVNSNCPIRTASPDTTHRQDCFVVCGGGACELGIILLSSG